MEIKIYRARFKTAGKTSEEIRSEYDDSIGPKPTDTEIQLWKTTLNKIDGAELYVTDSFLTPEDRLTIIGWPDEYDWAMMKFTYAAEQDPLFGSYQNEKEKFIEDWEASKYEPAGSLSVSSSDVEIIEELEHSNG